MVPFVPVEWEGEAAFVLNLGECGMAVQAMEILAPNLSVDFAFVLPQTRTRICGKARIAWSDRSGRAGLEFTRIPELQRHRLRRWALNGELKGSRPA